MESSTFTVFTNKFIPQGGEHINIKLKVKISILNI